MVLGDQVGHGATVIPEKTFRLLDASNEAPYQRRKPVPEIVAAAFPELLRHEWGPVRTTNLPTVEQDVFEGTARLIRGVLPDRIEKMVNVRIHGDLAHFIAFQSRRGGRTRGLSGACMADPQDGPIAFGGVPICFASKINDLLGSNGREGIRVEGQVGFDLHPGTRLEIVEAKSAQLKF